MQEGGIVEKSQGSHRGQGKGVGEKRVADARPLTGNQNICPIVNSRVQLGVRTDSRRC